MDKEKVKQALHEKYGIQYSGEHALLVDIMLDAIELMGQDEPVLVVDNQGNHYGTIPAEVLRDAQVKTGSLVLCPSCSGKGCAACKGAGTLKDVRHTPSGSLVVCPKCSGMGWITGSGCTCPACDGTGAAKAVSNTPSA